MYQSQSTSCLPTTLDKSVCGCGTHTRMCCECLCPVLLAQAMRSRLLLINPGVASCTSTRAFSAPASWRRAVPLNETSTYNYRPTHAIHGESMPVVDPLVLPPPSTGSQYSWRDSWKAPPSSSADGGGGDSSGMNRQAWPPASLHTHAQATVQHCMSCCSHNCLMSCTIPRHQLRLCTR